MTSKSVDAVEIKQTKDLDVCVSRRWAFIKTGFLVITWIILGVHAEIVGPTMKILAQQTGTTFSGISSILAARSAGYMFGSILGAVKQGFIKRYSDGLLSFAFLIASIVIFITPSIRSLLLLSIVFFIQGISQGFTDLGGTNLILTMWHDHSSTAMNTVHLGFGFGAVFVNLLVAPFLEKNEIIVSNVTSTSILENPFSSKISIPYTITASLCFLIAIGHSLFAIREHRIQRRTLQMDQSAYTTVTNVPLVDTQVSYSQYSPRSCGNGYFYYGLTMSILWIVYMFFVTANDLTFGKFFFSYLGSSKFELSTKSASLGMIIYWLSYSIGRLICAIVALFVSVDIVLSVIWMAGLILAIAWIVFVWIIGLSSTSLFILGSFTGLIFSPIFPLSFGFINQRLVINPLLLGLILCGASLGGVIFQKIGGIVMDINPQHFPTLLMICVLLSIVLYSSASLLSFCHRRQVAKKSQHAISKNVPIVSHLNEEEEEMTMFFVDTKREKQ
ncbi:unnamed protein product [Adineta steineri]|uniref:Sodium-dependent glucose transporter 1-like protein n=1 Tax=Adineta steineri TaxID=433720 RepID=A0A815BD99_9BILA|nr:unnamed protein product [Adineta steineri]CAF1267820.1 unnamed protein product [Adineta steineri]